MKLHKNRVKRVILLSAILLVILSAISIALLGPSGRYLRRLGVDQLLVRRGIEKLGGTIRIVPRNTPYDVWLAKAKSEIPVFEGLVIDDVRTVALQPWPQMGEGINGLYLRFADYQITDGRILEIPPHGETNPQRHLFEMGIYFFGGPGHTMIQQEGKKPQRVDWDYRSLYSIPLNVRYQHFNDSEEPIRLVAITSLPFVLNATNNEKFVFDNPFEFTDRYNADADYLQKRDSVNKNRTITNFVSDALEFKTSQQYHRRKGATSMGWLMSGNTMLSLHVAEMSAKIYKKAHRHSSDAFILVLSGDGYSVTWPEGAYHKRVRVDWHEGTLFVPPIYWYHQHLNPGSEPARYLAINAPVLVTHLGLRFLDQMEVDLSEIKAEWGKEIEKRKTID